MAGRMTRATLSIDGDEVLTAAYGPDGDRIVTANASGTGRVWPAP